MLQMVSTFKDRFIKAMEIRNIKAIELSEKTGISESTLSQYKGGYSKPKAKRLAIIADALEVDPAWLMGLNVPINTMSFASIEDYECWEAQNPSLSDEELDIIHAYRNANNDIQNATCAVLGVRRK